MRSALRTRIEIGLTLLAAAGAAAWAWAQLGPDSSLVGPWSSDGAIPVLMSNADRLTPFHLYYFGQDRFGALPFILASLWHRLSGFTWTPEQLAHLQALAILSSVFAVSKLLQPRAFFAIAWTALLVLVPWRFHLFDLCQPYGWQLTAMLDAWCALRWLRVRSAEASQACPLMAPSALAVALSFIAAWISAFSAPLLLCTAIAEALAVPSGRPIRARVLPVVAAIIGGGLEGVLRGLYQVYSKSHFGTSYRTELKLQLSGAPGAFWDAVSHLARGEAHWMFGVLMVATTVVFIAVVHRRLQREDSELHPNTVTLLGLGGMVFAAVALPSVLSHFRGNGLAEKYFTVPGYLAPLGVLIAIERLGARLWNARFERGLRAAALVPGVAFIAAPLWMPRAEHNPEFARLRRVARALAERAPGAFIVSGYWDTFSLAALALPGVLQPHAFDEQYQRTPHLRPDLRAASHVFVATEGSDGAPLPQLDPFLFVGGVPLERADEPAVELEGRRFERYRSAAARELDVGAPELLGRCPDEMVLRFEGSEVAHLVLVRRKIELPLPDVRAVSEAAGALGLEHEAFSGGLDAWRVPKAQGIVEVRIAVPAHPGSGCSITELHVLSEVQREPVAGSAP